MPLRGLRADRSEGDFKPRSFKRPTTDKTAPPGANGDHPGDGRGSVSEEGRRPSSDHDRDHDGAHDGDHDHADVSPPVQEHTPSTRRFSLLRFRHASDPQLSVKNKEHAHHPDEPPPVPAMPAGTPAIITTAPTMAEHEELAAAPRRPRLIPQFSLRRRSFDPSTFDRPSRKSLDKSRSSEIKRGPFTFKGLRNQNALAEEPERLKLSKSKSESTQEVASALSLPVPRPSVSSRSDGSTGHISFDTTPRPRPNAQTHGSARFGFRRNKQRASLFPLPMKVTPSEFPITAPATPRVSTSGVSSSSAHPSPSGETPPLTALNNARLHTGGDGADTPPVSSPSQVALAAASLNLVSPGSGLLRNDSTKSFQSSRSSPHSPPMRVGLRDRSSTMGSLGARSEDGPPPTPPYAASGRNSTSTAGRASFSNLFSLGARFRQNTDPYSPRHASPAHGFTGTSGQLSHQNSLNISREALHLPDREEGETSGHYLERIEETNMDKSVIASFLTKTDDPFMQAVLRSYMRKFAFFGDPIDMAVRKLLMQIELPKETQQIDRVLQGFADRYHECNPGIYVNPDQAYFLAFSVVILHTDFFNRNNKRKMQRNDYIKNSSTDGVSEDVLGCIYDNIVYTPFIRIEDEVDLKNTSQRRTKRIAALSGPLGPLTADPTKKMSREPIDPYTLILENKLDVLRPAIKEVMNLDDPYTYLGTAPTLDIRNLYKSFSRYGVIQIVSSRSRPEAFMSQSSQENPLESSVGIVEMPVTKVGVLWRKGTKRKKARSPWQEWGAVLTRSGLSLFRNSSWAKNLMHQHDQHQKNGDGSAVVFQPPLQEFKQDHIIPMDGAVALVDNTYKKHKYAFVMFSKAGEETFLADNEKDLNDWLGMVNYSAAFETLGVRPRGLVGGLYEGQRNRGIRRLESSHSAKSIATATGEVTIQSGKIDKQFALQMMNARKDLMQTRISESEERLAASIRQLEARLRDARHLQLMAPIQPKTRELVIHAAGRLSAKLKWARTEIWRMKCHRDILAQELEDEKQNANERQARIDRVDATSQPSQLPSTPQQSHKTSMINGLARLSSKASSLTSNQKQPVSPSASSARPGTKSSRDTEPLEEEAFKTPPETSQSSPNHPSAQYILSFSPPHSSQRRPSLATTSSAAQSPRLGPKEHRPSVSTMGDRSFTSDSTSEIGSQYATPPVEADKSELKMLEIPSTDGLGLDVDSGSEADQPLTAISGSPESRSKGRRSLHRTLRDSHVGSHRRSHKGRDSASTILSDDTQESEGLLRGKGSFTVHGKKASVITFGVDWHNMPAEERLKTRKQAQEALEALDDTDSVDDREVSTDDQARSIVSDTETVTNAPPATEAVDTTPRASSPEARKQRHVSSQTITPANYTSSVNGRVSDSNSRPEMTEIEEEFVAKDAGAVKDAIESDDDSDTDHLQMKGPKSQAVEA